MPLDFELGVVYLLFAINIFKDNGAFTDYRHNQF